MRNIPAMLRRADKTIAAVCLVIFVGLLFVGLWPLDFFPANEAWWLKDMNGIHFDGHGIGPRSSAGGKAFTPDSLVSPHQSLLEKGALSIEMWLRPAIEPKCGRSRILSFHDGIRNEMLFVDQWKSCLLVFFKIAGHGNGKKYREIGICKALTSGQPRFATITSGKNGIVIYLEGKPVKRFPGARLIPAGKSISGQTILAGNSSDATQSWAGDLFGLAVYDCSLTETQALQHFRQWMKSDNSPPPIQRNVVALYAFDERSGMWAHSSSGISNSLYIPAHLQFEKRFLAAPDISSLIKVSSIKDVIINIAGFIPFGFFLSLWLIKARQWNQRYAYIVAIGIGFLVSLTIELLQGYLPVRDSSMTDLCCNTFGTFFGVGIEAILNYWAKAHGTRI